MKAIPILLLSCLSILAQSPLTTGSGIDWTRATASTISPPSFSAIKFRYKASDLASTPVSVWTDEVSGYTWVQSGSGKPTWDAVNGVTFNGTSQYLVATNGIITTDTGAYLVIWKFNSVAANSYFIATGNFPNVALAMDAIGSLYHPAVADFAGLVTGHYFDFLACSTGGAFKVLTNGITGWSDATHPWNSGFNLAVTGAVGASGSSSPTHFGSFVLQEFIYWTNVGAVDATFIANAHKYATNTYNFTP